MFSDIEDYYVPFDGRSYSHREIAYDPQTLRKKRPNLFILTNRPECVVEAFARETDGVVTTLRDFSDAQISETAFYVYFSRAELILPLLRRIVACGGLFAPPPFFDKASFFQISGKALETYNEAGQRLGDEPFGGPVLHAQICQAVEITRHVAGAFVEIGVFSGSSALTALTHMRNLGLRRHCWLIDTFDGFQYATAAESADMIWSNTHILEAQPTVDRVTRLLWETNQDIRIVQGDICSAPLPAEIVRVALANIDVDLYEAVLASLNKLAPVMAHRGVMIVEDATSLPGLYGAYLALQDFLQSPPGRDFVPVNVGEQYFLIRVNP